jgi:hypothetical protein
VKTVHSNLSFRGIDIGMVLEDIIKKIVSGGSCTDEEVVGMIKAKQQELSGLVSLEGAAYIVAKEMGLDLVERRKTEMKLKDIVAGLRNLAIVARVINLYPAKEYSKNGNTFKVGNVILSDGTGSVRMSLWDAQTEVLDKLEPGMAIEIFGGYSRDNGRGEVELRIGRAGGIRESQGEGLPAIEEMKSAGLAESSIAKLGSSGQYSIRATVAQLFENEQFYEVCGDCGKRTKPDEEGKFTCPDHGNITPALTMVVSGVIDDGSGNIRAVFFRDSAGKFLGMTIEEAVKRKGKVFETVDVLGKEFIFAGRVRMNKMFSRPEFIVSDLAEVDDKKEVEKLMKELTPKGI